MSDLPPPTNELPPGIIWSAQTAKAMRDYEDKEGVWIIEFEYNPFACTVPATSPLGKPHYSAKVKVFKVKDDKKVQVGPAFQNDYIEGGCFEDKSSDIVAKAKKLAEEKHE